MFKNYLLLAARNLKHKKVFSFINIFGLALGISLCLLIITILKDQFSFDRIHPDADRIFRVNTEAIRKNGSTEGYASSPLALAKTIENKYAYIEKSVPLVRALNGEAEAGGKQLPVSCFLTTPEFFDIFGYTLLYGDKSSALKDINTIVLTENTAELFFGRKNPVGETLAFRGIGNFRITGVIKKPSGKTHLEFDALASYNSLPALVQGGSFTVREDDWLNYYMNYTYVKLTRKNDAAAFEKELTAIAKDKYAKLELENRDKGYRFYLQPLGKIVPGPMLSNNMGRALPLPLLLFLVGLALAVIISAGFNYNSLSLANSLSRAKEIGVRKATGAKRKQLVFQFLTEAVFTSLVAMVLAIIIYEFILKPGFYNLRVIQAMDISLDGDIALYILFAIFSIVVGLASGLLPALFISAMNPVKALKDFSGKAMVPKLGFRRILLVVQFSAALLFVIAMINMYRQINFVMNAEYGFNKEDIVTIDLQGNSYDKVKQALEGYSGVELVSGISHPIGTWRDRAVDVRIKPEDEEITVRDYTIDENFLKNLKLVPIAGKNFNSGLPANREINAIVNETFLKRFNLGTPAEAIGKTMFVNDSTRLEISGVLKDFHYKPFVYNIEPLLLRYQRNDLSVAYVSISHENPPATIAQLKKIWSTIDKTHEFTYSFFKDDLQNTYTEMKDISRMVGVVAFMALVVACLGLLGLVIFIIHRQVKEIGIRKILGASTSQIIVYLSTNFMKLLLLACAIGLPLGIVCSYFMLNTFAFRINPVPGYIAGVLTLLAIALTTIGIKISQAATANPVNSLRTE
jgi:putative ABC transport system permease protein